MKTRTLVSGTFAHFASYHKTYVESASSREVRVRLALPPCGRDAHTDSRRDGGATSLQAIAPARLRGAWALLCLLVLLMSLPATAQVKFAGVTNQVPLPTGGTASQFLTDSQGGIYSWNGTGVTYWALSDGTYQQQASKSDLSGLIACAVQNPGIVYCLASDGIHKLTRGGD